MFHIYVLKVNLKIKLNPYLSTQRRTSGPSSCVSARHTAMRPIRTAAHSWSKLAWNGE